MPCECLTPCYISPPCGDFVSSATPVPIAAGKLVENFIVLEAGARVRTWKLLNPLEGANIPNNPKRAYIWVDNQSDSANAYFVFGTEQNPLPSSGVRRIWPGESLELYVRSSQIGIGQMAVCLDTETPDAVIVTEVSYDN